MQQKLHSLYPWVCWRSRCNRVCLYKADDYITLAFISIRFSYVQTTHYSSHCRYLRIMTAN